MRGSFDAHYPVRTVRCSSATLPVDAGRLSWHPLNLSIEQTVKDSITPEGEHNQTERVGPLQYGGHQIVRKM
jgi:hypothetical protein